MPARYLCAALLLALTALTPHVARLHAQAQAPSLTAAAPTSLTSAPLTHLGIVVPDIEKVARGYADLWGMAVPEIKTVSLEMTDGKKAETRVAYVPLPNFYLEILQPV